MSFFITLHHRFSASLNDDFQLLFPTLPSLEVLCKKFIHTLAIFHWIIARNSFSLDTAFYIELCTQIVSNALRGCKIFCNSSQIFVSQHRHREIPGLVTTSGGLFSLVSLIITHLQYRSLILSFLRILFPFHSNWFV